MNGTARQGFPFAGACTALARDNFGTMIECWQLAADATTPASFHAALSVGYDDDTIMEISREAGWRCAVRQGGPFSVVEVWVENRTLLELLSPTQTEKYLLALASL